MELISCSVQYVIKVLVTRFFEFVEFIIVPIISREPVWSHESLAFSNQWKIRRKYVTAIASRPVMFETPFKSVHFSRWMDAIVVTREQVTN